jgi:hypothetical protein
MRTSEETTSRSPRALWLNASARVPVRGAPAADEQRKSAPPLDRYRFRAKAEARFDFNLPFG